MPSDNQPIASYVAALRKGLVSTPTRLWSTMAARSLRRQVNLKAIICPRAVAVVEGDGNHAERTFRRVAIRALDVQVSAGHN